MASHRIRIDPEFAFFELRVGRSPIDRYGVFAAENIPPGKRVIEYTGQRVRAREAAKRVARQFLAGRASRIYIIEAKRGRMLDGAVGGSGAELINQSCNPNLTSRRIQGKIFLYSRRRISAGEELTADYGFRCSCPCRCGARNCRGVMCHV